MRQPSQVYYTFFHIPISRVVSALRPPVEVTEKSIVFTSSVSSPESSVNSGVAGAKIQHQPA